jgi:hypothetical protein
MAQRDLDVEEVRASRLRQEKGIDPGYKKDWRKLAARLLPTEPVSWFLCSFLF